MMKWGAPTSIVWVLLLIMFSMATGVGGNAGAAGAPLGPVTVFTGIDPVFAPLYVADAKGLFRKNGVIVDVHKFPAGALAVQAARSAKAGFVFAGDLPSLKIWEAGDMVGIAPAVWDYGNVQFVVTKDIKRPDDLRGKTVSSTFGSTDHIALMQYLSVHGLSGDVRVVNLTSAQLVPALSRGDIQGFVWTYLATHQALAAVPGSRLLFEGTSGLITERFILSASLSTANGNPAVIVAVLRGFHDANIFLQNHPKEAAQALAKDEGIPEDRALAIIRLSHYDMTYDRRFVQDMTTESEKAAKLGLLKGPVDVKRHFETKFLATLGKEFVKAGH